MPPKEPPLESEAGGHAAYARGLSKLTELVSPVWDLIQWSAVFNVKFIGTALAVFFVSLIGLMLYSASRGPWLCIWLNAVFGLSVC